MTAFFADDFYIPKSGVTFSHEPDSAMSTVCLPRSGELRTPKLKSHLVRTQSLNVLPLKPGVGQSVAIHATLSARDFLLTYFYPSDPFTCIFSKPLPIFPVLAVAKTWFLCRPAE